jgi:NTE family protein
MKSLIKTLILSGGGVKGIAYIGIIKRLDELKASGDVKFEINEMCCVSIGSFVGILYLIGYTYDELYDEIMSKEIDSLKNFRIKNLLEKYGMDNGKLITTWLESMLLKKGISKDITLREIWIKFGINFRVVVTNINKYCIEIFDYKKNPNLKVVKAIRMSTSIPFVFCAERYNDNIYVDGGMLNNYPIKLYEEYENMDNVLGCKLVTRGEFGEFHDDVNNKIDSFESYLVHLTGCLFANKERDTTLAYKYIEHTICINAYKITQPINFTLNEDEKRELIDMGYSAACDYFDKSIKS